MASVSFAFAFNYLHLNSITGPSLVQNIFPSSFEHILVLFMHACLAGD